MAELFICSLAARSLIWENWDGVSVVYQPSSAETHIFNETTSMILTFLDHETLSLNALKLKVGLAHGIGPDELDSEDLSFAVRRLEELGLIERVNDLTAVQ